MQFVNNVILLMNFFVWAAFGFFSNTSINHMILSIKRFYSSVYVLKSSHLAVDLLVSTEEILLILLLVV